MSVQICPAIRREYIDALRFAQTLYDDADFIPLTLQLEIDSQKKALRIRIHFIID